MISSGGMAVRGRASIAPILLSYIRVRFCSQTSCSCPASLWLGLRSSTLASSSIAPEKSLSASSSRAPRIHTSVSSSATASLGSASLWMDQAPLVSSDQSSCCAIGMATEGPSSQGVEGGGGGCFCGALGGGLAAGFALTAGGGGFSGAAGFGAGPGFAAAVGFAAGPGFVAALSGGGGGGGGGSENACVFSTSGRSPGSHGWVAAAPAG